MKRTRVVLMVLFALLIAMGVHATGGSEESAEKQVTVTYWTSWDSTDLHYPAMQIIYESFREDNPNVNLQVEEMPIDVLRQKMQTSMAAGGAPVVVHINGDMTQASGHITPKLWAENGKLINLTPILNADPDWRDNFIPEALERGVVGEEVYGLPFQFSFSYMIYNQKILDETGQNFPETWEELLVLSRQLKDMGYRFTVLGGKEAWMPRRFLLPLAEGIPGARAEFDAATSGEGSFQTPNLRRIFTMFNEFLQNGGIFLDEFELSDGESHAQFMMGQTLAISDGEWMYGWIQNESEAAGTDTYEHIDLALYPVMNGVGPMYGYDVFTSLALSSEYEDDAATIEAGIEFIKLMTSVETAELMAELTQSSTGVKIDTGSLELTDLMAKNYTLFGQAETAYAPSSLNLAWDIIKDGTISLEMGMSVDEVLAQMDADMAALLEQRGN